MKAEFAVHTLQGRQDKGNVSPTVTRASYLITLMPMSLTRAEKEQTAGLIGDGVELQESDNYFKLIARRFP